MKYYVGEYRIGRNFKYEHAWAKDANQARTIFARRHTGKFPSRILRFDRKDQVPEKYCGIQTVVIARNFPIGIRRFQKNI